MSMIKIYSCSGMRWGSDGLPNFIITNSLNTLPTSTNSAILRTWITSTKSLTSTRPLRIISKRIFRKLALHSRVRTWLFKKGMIYLRPSKFSWKIHRSSSLRKNINKVFGNLTLSTPDRIHSTQSHRVNRNTIKIHQNSGWTENRQTRKRSPGMFRRALSRSDKHLNLSLIICATNSWAVLISFRPKGQMIMGKRTTRIKVLCHLLVDLCTLITIKSTR